MTANIKTVLILVIFCTAAAVPAGANVACTGQDEAEYFVPEYRSFLAGTQMIMSAEEREEFLRFQSDRDRDFYMASFWQARGGRQQAVRANINLLMLMRMVQELDLTEDQIAGIMPVMNRIEKEKQQLQSGILKELRELRGLLADGALEERSLAEKVSAVRDMEMKLREKEVEWNVFIEERLSVVQRAKYILFIQDFYRELREKLSDARRVQQRLGVMNKKR